MAADLIAMAPKFDPTRWSIEAFCTVIIRTWILMELRRRRCEKRGGRVRVRSLDSSGVVVDGQPRSLAEVLGEEDGRRLTGIEGASPTEHLERRELTEMVLASLSPDERELVDELVTHGVTETARRRGTSRYEIDKWKRLMRQRFPDFD